VTTRMLVNTQRQVLVVPQDAVQHGPAGLFAYVIGDDDKVTAKPIKVSLDSQDGAVIADGLALGQKVVVAGQSRLQNGALVDAQPMASTGEKVASRSAPPADGATEKKAD